MMKPLEYRFNLDLLDQSSHTILNARQGDNCSKMIVTLSEGDKPYAAEDGAVIIFVALKPDGHYIYDNCSVENGCIIYAFNDQTVPVSGMVACQFKLLGGDGEGDRLTTPVFRMAVNSNVNVDEEQIVSSDTYTALTDLIDEIHHDLDTGAFIGPQGPAGPEGAQGPKGDTGAKGDPGNDGDTPLISSVHLDTGPHKNHTEVIFTYHNGIIKSVYLPDGAKGDTGATGAKGDPGEDGYSPTATVTKTGTQSTIRITDKNGTTEAVVSDGAKGDTGPQGPKGDPGAKGDPGEDGRDVTVITAEEFPESLDWNGTIPTTFAGKTGEVGEIALYYDYASLWYLAEADGASYEWERIPMKSETMLLAKTNPTSEQIAAMSTGQFYSDTTNKKGIIKGVQDFYDTTYIDSSLINVRRVYTPDIVLPYRTSSDDLGTYLEVRVSYSSSSSSHLKEMETGDFIRNSNGDLWIVAWRSTNFAPNYSVDYGIKLIARAGSEYYTKSEIDSMIGNIETDLSQV